MKNYKKHICMLLSLIMIFGTMGTLTFASELASDNPDDYKLSITVNPEDLTFTVTAENNTGEDLNATLFVATYSGREDILTFSHSEEITISSSITTTSYAYAESDYSIKAFLWDGSIAPLAECAKEIVQATPNPGQYISLCGIVVETPITAIDHPIDIDTTKDKYIKLFVTDNNGYNKYEIGQTYSFSSAHPLDNKYLGYAVDLLIEKPSDTIVDIDINNKMNSKISFDVNDFRSYEKNSNTLTYYAYGAIYELALENTLDHYGSCNTIYNGIAYSGTLEDMFGSYVGDKSGLLYKNNSFSGKVTVLDNNIDSKYDVIFIEIETGAVVNSIDNGIMTFKNTIGDPIYLNYINEINFNPEDTNKYINVTKNGKIIDYESIDEDDVLSIVANNSNSYYDIQVLDKSIIEGVVSNTYPSNTSQGGVSYTITQNTYNQSTYDIATDFYSEDTLNESSSGKFYIGRFDKMIAYKYLPVTFSSYGYILSYDFGETEDDFRIMILTQNNTRVYYSIHEDILINGELCENADDFIAALKIGASYQNTGTYGNTDIQQVIKYAETVYDGKKYLDSIYTVTADTDLYGGHDVVSDRLYNYANLKRGTVPVKYLYNKLTGTGVDLNVSPSIVFLVPEDAERTDANSFRRIAAPSYFTNNRTYDSVEAFDVSKGNAPKVVVVYAESAVKGVDDSSPLFVLDEAPGNEHNSDIGENMYRASGYKITKSNSSSVKATTEWASISSNSVMRSAALGDIYRIGEDSDGYKTFERDYKLYPASQGYLNTGKSKPANWNSAEFCTIYGSVYAANSDDGMVVLPEVVSSYDDVSDIDQYTIAYNRFGGAKMLIYDESGSRTRITEIPTDVEDRKAVFDTMDSYSNGFEPNRVLVYMSEGNVRLLVVIVD